MAIIHEPCVSRGSCYHSRAGRIGGRKNVESGHLQRISSLGGRVGGRKNVESGHLQRICSLGGRIQGRKNVESGHLQRICSLGGRRNMELHGSPGCIQGRKNVESGQLARIRELPQTKAAQRENGRKNVESGRLTENSYGIPCITEDGILVKSMAEVIFYSVSLALGGQPKYEPVVIDNYTPDFILGKSVLGLPANVPLELKPCREWLKFRDNKQRIAPGVLVVYANELWKK